MKKYWERTKEDSIYKIVDLDVNIIVEHFSRKYLLSSIDDYIENIQYGYEDADTTYSILYADGTTDYIDSEYDGHKIRKINIVSIIENNSCTSIVFGGYEINDCGVVSTSDKISIDTSNIVQI